jgi:hypothetical protein
MATLPVLGRAATDRAALRLAVADPARPGLLAAARHVALLQQTVHGAHLEGIPAGRFTLLNRAFDFGSLDRVSWRGEFDDGNNPLRRMTLAYMGYAVPMLARGRAGDRDVIVRLLRSLEDQNPFSARGAFRDVWNPYTASHRLINLLAGLALYRDGGGVPDRAQEAEILDHVRFCAAFVARNLERELQYNHLMKNYVALAFYASGLEQVPAELAFLREAVPEAVRQNVLADGGPAERCPMYHALALLDVRMLRAGGVFADEWGALLEETAGRMAAALAVMTHPDGDVALFNDSWLGEAPPAAALIEADAPPAARLPETGYVRLGEGGDAVIFDYGPCGPDDNPGHAHADFLSLEVSVAGARLVVDCGVPTYTAGSDRDLSRSAKSHNGPHLDGIEPIEFWKSFRVGRRGRAYELLDDGLAEFAPLWCAGSQDGYAHKGVSVRRFVGLWPGRALLVCDLWRGRHEFPEASNFLISGHWSCESAVEAGRHVFVSAAARVEVTALAGHARDPVPARHWTRFGVEEQAHSLVLDPVPSGEVRTAALWWRWGEGAAPPDDDALRGLFARLAAC